MNGDPHTAEALPAPRNAEENRRRLLQLRAGVVIKRGKNTTDPEKPRKPTIEDWGKRAWAGK